MPGVRKYLIQFCNMGFWTLIMLKCYRQMSLRKWIGFHLVRRLVALLNLSALGRDDLSDWET
jgi:hypothetical protein